MKNVQDWLIFDDLLKTIKTDIYWIETGFLNLGSPEFIYFIHRGLLEFSCPAKKYKINDYLPKM